MTRLHLLGFIALVLTAICLVVFFTGCTTMSHDKECVCDCKGADAHFECSGIHEYKHRDIK